MALFGSLGARSKMASMFPTQADRLAQMGVVPYYPTPEERATAIPANFAQPIAKPPTGMFGSGLSGPIQSALRAAMPTPPGGVLSAAVAQGVPPGPTSRSPLADALDLPLPSASSNPSNLPMPDLSNAQVRHPGFFHHGGLGEKILHGLGEFALNYSASQGDQGALMTLRGRMEEQAAQRRAIEAVKQRQAEREEWTWRENYKREHPDDQFTSFMVAAGIDPHSEQGQRLYRQRAEGMAAPPLMAVDGFDAQGNFTKTFVPRPTAGGTGATSTTPNPAAGPPVGTVRNGFRFMGGHPNDRGSWQPVSGGATPTVTPPFGR